MNTKATLYLDTTMYRTLKVRAAETGQTISAIMNDALKAQLAEDMDDIAAIHDRLQMRETAISYEAALTELRARGII